MYLIITINIRNQTPAYIYIIGYFAYMTELKRVLTSMDGCARSAGRTDGAAGIFRYVLRSFVGEDSRKQVKKIASSGYFSWTLNTAHTSNL